MFSPAKFSGRVVSVLVIALFGCSPAARSDPSPAPVLTRAKALFDSYDYQQALAALEETLIDHPQHRPAQRLKLLSLCKSDRSAWKAISYGRQIMAEHPPFGEDPDLW